MYFNSLVSRIYGIKLLLKIKLFRPDLLIVLGSGTELYGTTARCTVFLVADANFHLLQNAYPPYTSLSRCGIKMAQLVEKTSLAKFDCVLYSSEWALSSTAMHYPSLQKKLHIINLGSNLPIEGLHTISLPTQLDEIRLLTIGLEYNRKGIDRSQKIAHQLGCQLQVIGTNSKVNKENPLEMAQLIQSYQNAHFFILLPRADCTPIVINEANSFGLPVIAARVGGIASMIKEGVNGHLVDTEDEAIRIIEKYSANIESYQLLRKSTFKYYSQHLSWNVFEKKLISVFEKQTSKKGPQVEQP